MLPAKTIPPKEFQKKKIKTIAMILTTVKSCHDEKNKQNDRM